MNNLTVIKSTYLGKPIDLDQQTILAASAFIAGYRNLSTRKHYTNHLRDWFSFCTEYNLDPMKAKRFEVELWVRSLERRELKPKTIALKLSSVKSFYKYCKEEKWVKKNPSKKVKPPRIERISSRKALTRIQVADLMNAASEEGGYTEALIMILTFNGLRISEVCNADIEHIKTVGFSSVLVLPHRKGDKSGEAVLCEPLKNSLRVCLGDRQTGPLLLNTEGRRMTPGNARRILRKLSNSVRGYEDNLTPHVLRHSWVTLAVQAGVNIKRLQRDGGWSDPRMIDFYDHSPDNPLTATAHSVAAHVLSV